MKRFLLSLVMMLISFASFGQIQTTFFGLTIGKSTRSTVVNTLKAKGYKLHYEGSTIILLKERNRISFAGRNGWSCLFEFYNNTLRMVSFSDVSFTKNNLVRDYKILVSKYDDKYSKYRSPVSREGLTIYSDDNTCCSITISYEGGQYVFGVGYVDLKLINQEEEAVRNEI